MMVFAMMGFGKFWLHFDRQDLSNLNPDKQLLSCLFFLLTISYKVNECTSTESLYMQLMNY